MSVDYWYTSTNLMSSYVEAKTWSCPHYNALLTLRTVYINYVTHVSNFRSVIKMLNVDSLWNICWPFAYCSRPHWTIQQDALLCDKVMTVDYDDILGLCLSSFPAATQDDGWRLLSELHHIDRSAGSCDTVNFRWAHKEVPYPTSQSVIIGNHSN